jgi:hypothetical protein
LGVAVTTDGRHGWAVGDNGTILATEDCGGHWAPQISSTSQSLSAVAVTADGRHGWAVGKYGTILITGTLADRSNVNAQSVLGPTTVSTAVGSENASRIWSQSHSVSVIPENGWVQVVSGPRDVAEIVLSGPRASRGAPVVIISELHGPAVSDIELEQHRKADIERHQEKVPGYQAGLLPNRVIVGHSAVAWTATWPTRAGPVKFESLVTKVGTSIYDFTYEVAQEDYDSQHGAFDRMISSVRFGE